MNIKVVTVNAFTDKPFGGNPAAVCILKQSAETNWMQHIAREMNQPATAFVLRQNGDNDHFDLRWFAPDYELAFCGHGTLSSAFALWELGISAPSATLHFSTKRGALSATRSADGWITLDLPTEGVEPVDTLPPGLLESLKVTPYFTGKTTLDYFVVIDGGLQEITAMQPDFRLLKTIKTRGVIVTSKADSTDFDFVSRYFCATVGIDEDPVTGSAHCALVPYWQKELGKSEFRAYQASSRGGSLRALAAGQRIHLSGQAVTIMRGTLA